MPNFQAFMFNCYENNCKYVNWCDNNFADKMLYLETSKALGIKIETERYHGNLPVIFILLLISTIIFPLQRNTKIFYLKWIFTKNKPQFCRIFLWKQNFFFHLSKHFKVFMQKIDRSSVKSLDSFSVRNIFKVHILNALLSKLAFKIVKSVSMKWTLGLIKQFMF